jgi:hypothetical protein
MAIIDNTLAAQVPTFDAATPLAQAAKLQAAETEIRQQQFKQMQTEIGSEARGLVPFVNTPEFPARWAETADRMLQKGLLNPQTHQQWRNAPSPLLLKQMIAQTEDPTLTFRKEEAQREQGNANRTFSFREQQAAREQGNTERELAIKEKMLTSGKLPAGFESNPEGGLRPIAGGPADPKYKRTVTDKQNAPAGYKWADPNDQEAGLVAIPGGPGEKISAEVAARVGLAKSFIGQLDDYKDVEGNDQKGLRARIKAGEATGLFDGPMGAANVGEPGSIRRKISSGAEALLRNLTGAGMNIDEAKKYVSRYEPQWNDSAKTLLDKVNQLERELRSVTDTVGKGRGGNILEDKPKKTTGPTGPTTEIPQAAIQALRSNPDLRDQFEAKYGKGTAKVVLR